MWTGRAPNSGLPGRKPVTDDLNDALRERSGKVIHEDRLTSFLYELMRDYLPPGKVESMVRGTETETPPLAFSNGWLATYAHDLAGRLKADD